MTLKGGNHISCCLLINSPSTLPKKRVFQKCPVTATEALQVAAVGDFADTWLLTQASKGFLRHAKGSNDSK